MAKKKKRISKPVAKPAATPMPEPVLASPPKSRSRRCVETAVWSVIVFWLFISYRVHVFYQYNVGKWIGTFLSPSFLVPISYAPDYSLGFLPRTLPGQLLTFFAGGAMKGPDAGAYFLMFYAVTYGLLSLILGKLIEKALSAKSYLLAMFPLLIIFTPPAVGVGSFAYGHLDTFMFLFALAAFFLMKSEKLMWLVPVCVCLGIMTSESYMLLFFPLVFALLYYEFIKGGMKRTRLFNLIATTVSSFALEVYMLWAASHSELVSKYSFEDSIAYLERKIGRVLTYNLDDLHLVCGVFGKILDGQKYSFISMMAINAESQFDYFKPIYYVIALLICAPILIFTLSIWRKHMKGEKGFWKKSPYMLFMLAPAIIFPAFLFFSDMHRLVFGVLITQVLWLAYVFFEGGQDEAFKRLKEISTGKYRWLLYAAVFLGVIVPLRIFPGANLLIPLLDISALGIFAG